MTERDRQFLRSVVLQYVAARDHGDSCLCLPCVFISPEKKYYSDEGGES